MSYLSLDHYYGGEKKEEIDKKVTLHGYHNFDQELSLNEIYRKLKEAGIEVTSDGKIVLYYVTSGKNLLKILKKGVILPANETSNLTGRKQGEEDGEKLQKIYLTKLGTKVFDQVRLAYTGTTYVLKVFIDVDQIGNLGIDEDARYANTFLDSLASELGTCSYMGSLKDFEVVKKQSFGFGFDDKFFERYKPFFYKFKEIYEELCSLKYNLEILEKNFYTYGTTYDVKLNYEKEINLLLDKIKTLKGGLETYSPSRIVRGYNRIFDARIDYILAKKGKRILEVEEEDILKMSNLELYLYLENLLYYLENVYIK